MPPLLNTYRTNYTTISELLASPLTATPTAVRRIDPFTPPVVYNWSLGVQRDVGFNLIADAAYVGNAGRDQPLTVDLNGRPYGYAYQPSSLDPTTVVGGQAQPLPDDFLRPYQGFGRIQQREFAGYSDYHALQFSVNRRRSSDGLSVGAAYTYQIVNKSLGAIDPFVDDNRARNYTSNGRRPHVLVLNYSYDVPNLSQKWNNLVAKVDLRQLAVLRASPRSRPAPTAGSPTATPTCRRERCPAPARSTAAAQPRRDHLRSESAARRAHLRAAVQDRVHRATDGSVPSRHGPERRISRARVT